MEKKTILFVCVDYKSAEDSLSLYKDVRSQTISESIKFVVVCNSGVHKLKSLTSSVKDPLFILEEAEDNIGYLPAAHRSISRYLDSNPQPDFVIVSNSDVEISDRHFFENLITLGQNFSVIAPKIITLDGVDQNPFLISRPSRQAMKKLEWIFSYRTTFIIYDYLSRIKKRLRKWFSDEIVKDKAQTIFAPHGSFMIFTKRYFEYGGNLSHDLFLYGEELHVGCVCHAKGLIVNYEPSLEVIHREHAVTSGIGSTHKANYLKSAITNTLHKYY